jgi:hypothetical protein
MAAIGLYLELIESNQIIFTPIFFKIHFNIIRPSAYTDLPAELFSRGFPTRIFYAFLILPMRVTNQAQLMFLK